MHLRKDADAHGRYFAVILRDVDHVRRRRVKSAPVGHDALFTQLGTCLGDILGMLGHLLTPLGPGLLNRAIGPPPQRVAFTLGLDHPFNRLEILVLVHLLALGEFCLGCLRFAERFTERAGTHWPARLLGNTLNIEALDSPPLEGAKRRHRDVGERRIVAHPCRAEEVGY